MNAVKIFTDSTADLTTELINKYSISVVPLYVILDGVSYRDGVDIDTESLYKLIDDKGKLSSTSALTPLDYENAFRPWVEKGYDVVYVGLSSELSSSLQNARIAAREFEEGRVYVVDSLNLSTGIGLLVLQAAEYAASRMDAKTIYEQISALVPRVRSSFIIDTLKYLYMGGRCSSLQKWISSVLKIHPRIIVSGGKMIVGEKFKGKRSIVLKGLLDTALIKKDKIDPHRIFITHSACTDEEIEYLKSGLESALDIEEILVTDAGCVISSHCGPKTIGILYIEKA